jgi:ABC-2 type transport system ATP-binding protein
VSADGRRAIVFSSHIVSDIERLANRIWILKEGRLDWQGDLDSLKESIVRLHLRGSGPLPQGLAIPGALSIRRENTFPSAIVRDWTDAAQRELERQIAGLVEVEALGLEEIFVELHR